MKQAAYIIAMVFIALSATAKGGKVKNESKYRSGNPAKKVVYGTIKDARNKPMKGVSAFVYGLDSTVLANATSDSAGRFQTNGVLPGKYFIKLIYPNKTVALVYNFTITTKDDLLLNVKMNAPEADTMMQYEALMPKPVAELKKK